MCPQSVSTTVYRMWVSFSAVCRALLANSQQLFEIHCLTAEAKQASSDIATIVKKYIEQEPIRTERAGKFNIPVGQPHFAILTESN